MCAARDPVAHSFYLQIRQFAKFKSPQKFPAIRYVGYAPLGSGGMSYCNHTPFPLREGGSGHGTRLAVSLSHCAISLSVLSAQASYHLSIHLSTDSASSYNLCVSKMDSEISAAQPTSMPQETQQQARARLVASTIRFSATASKPHRKDNLP